MKFALTFALTLFTLAASAQANEQFPVLRAPEGKPLFDRNGMAPSCAGYDRVYLEYYNRPSGRYEYIRCVAGQAAPEL